jgi:lysophospholipase L1-like esterase
MGRKEPYIKQQGEKIMTRILFQGDSITDCSRSKSDDSFKGTGYPHLVMGHLNFENPGQYEFFNRGISGNKIVDLYARMRRDLIKLKPDVMSILIGVNDVWHGVEADDGVDEEKFEKIYDMLLSEVEAELPDIKIIILGAFILKSTASAGAWDALYDGTKKRAEIAKRLAPYVEEACDRMEQEGGVLYDEYPDQLILRLTCREICRQIQQEDDAEDVLLDICQILLYHEMYLRRCERREKRSRKFF